MFPYTVVGMTANHDSVHRQRQRCFDMASYVCSRAGLKKISWLLATDTGSCPNGIVRPDTDSSYIYIYTYYVGRNEERIGCLNCYCACTLFAETEKKL